MAKLDLEPTPEEIEEAAQWRYQSEYNAAIDRMFYDGDTTALLDLECIVEQELMREKRLQVELNDAIVSV